MYIITVFCIWKTVRVADTAVNWIFFLSQRVNVTWGASVKCFHPRTSHSPKGLNLQSLYSFSPYVLM